MPVTKLKVFEIFQSIQGEGHNTGLPVVFVRLSGCNLKCSFCDTQHMPAKFEVTPKDLAEKIKQYKLNQVVFTGGEPMMQLKEKFLYELKKLIPGLFVAVETNGYKLVETIRLRELKYINWVTFSPKSSVSKAKIDGLKRLMLTYIGDLIDEVKIVVSPDLSLKKVMKRWVPARYYYLQPCWGANNEKDVILMAKLLNRDKDSFFWKVSFQVHKLVGVE